MRYPSGIDWNGHQVKFVIGIAGAGDDHLALLSKIGKVFVDRDAVAQLEAAKSVEEVRSILGYKARTVTRHILCRVTVFSAW